MNILINSYCNLHCSYCFADPTMKETGAANMTVEDFQKVLDWQRQNGFKEARLIGGEPTLAPNFSLFMDILKNDQNITNILIFSNMTFGKEIADKILEVNKFKEVAILANINEFDLLIPKHKKTILNNINIMYHGLQTFRGIGINIYRPDMDLTQWENIYSLYPEMHYLRYSIAVPSQATLQDNFDFYEYYHQFQPMLEKLSHFSAKYKVYIGCDCNNLPICCYDDDFIINTMKESGYSLFAPADMSPEGALHCGYPIIDIQPDLTIAPCFGHHVDEKVKLTDFANNDELMEWAKRVGDENGRIARKECLGCVRYQRTGVSCSCKSCHLIEK